MGTAGDFEVVLPRRPRLEVVAHGAVGGCHGFDRAGLTGCCL